MPQEPVTGATPGRSPQFRAWRGRSSRRGLIRLVTVVALLTLTGWNLTRSTSLAEAKAASVRGNQAVCLEKALDHLARRPWSRAAARLAALSLSQLNYADEAERYYERAGTLSLDDLQIRAYALVRRNRAERAIAVYHEILARSPDNVAALRRLAAVELTLNDNDALMDLSERLIRIPEGAAYGFTLLGVVQHNNDNARAAVEAFERVLELDPELKSMPLPRRLFWSHLCNDLVAVGRTSDARRYLESVVRQSPDASLVDFLGFLFEREGDLEEAERCWHQALELSPRSVAPMLNLGKLAERRKQYPKALDYLKRAEELAPQHYEILYHLSLTYNLMGRKADAALYRKKVEQLRSTPAQPVPATSSSSLPDYAL
jgi:tetratricopeptide (TPR) repeat protein